MKPFDDSFWYFETIAGLQGPVAGASLHKLANDGEIGAGTPIWAQGLPQWIAAGSVESLGIGPPPSDWVGPSDLPSVRNVSSSIAWWFGWLSVLLIPAPMALGFGWKAIREIRVSRTGAETQSTDLRRAVFGLVAGAIGSIVLMLGILATATA